MDIKARKDELIKLIDKFEGTLNIPITRLDPDALGAAFGLSFIFNSRNKKTRIVCCGKIGNRQNRLIVEEFGLKQKMTQIHIDEFSERFADDKSNQLALVDCLSKRDCSLLGKDKHPIVIIDHHKSESELEQGDNEFYWVEIIGSASTLITELIRELELEFSEDEKYIAKLLALGIYTDTKSLIGGCSRDRKAYEFLSKSFLYREISHIVNYSLPKSYYTHLALALNKIEQHESRLVTGVGFIDKENSDDISAIADELARWQDVSMVVVWGIIEEERIVRVCVRTNNLNIPLDEYLLKKFKDDSGAKSTPDGKEEGGAKLKLGLDVYWEMDITKEDVENIVFKVIKYKIFSEE